MSVTGSDLSEIFMVFQSVINLHVITSVCSHFVADHQTVGWTQLSHCQQLWKQTGGETPRIQPGWSCCCSTVTLTSRWRCRRGCDMMESVQTALSSTGLHMFMFSVGHWRLLVIFAVMDPSRECSVSHVCLCLASCLFTVYIPTLFHLQVR